MTDIVKIPDKILSSKTKEVSIIEVTEGKHAQLFEQMHTDMVVNKGVGLAANQIGLDLAVFVIDKKIAEEENVPDVYINPEITEYSKEEDEEEEGCLSIPGQYMPVIRSKKIWIKFIDKNGKKQKLKAKGFLARIFQHETDHLRGIVIKDRVRS